MWHRRQSPSPGGIDRASLGAKLDEGDIMQPKTSRADFAALARRAQLPLTEAQLDDIHGGAWAYIERMLERLRGTDRDRSAEPAHVFRPEGT